MNTVLLANNRLGVDVARYLAERDELLALVVHPPDRQRNTGGLFELDVPVHVWPEGLTELRRIAPECVLSVLFGFKLDAAWLSLPSWLPVNLHPGYLPFNKGAAPNVWPLVDGTPAGTTLHVMDASFDTGPILCQRLVPVRFDDTGASLYRRLEAASIDMFQSEWPTLRDLEPKRQTAEGTSHRRAELSSLDPRTPAELALIDRLRARTFPPWGAEFERDGRRFRIRVEIEEISSPPG